MIKLLEIALFLRKVSIYSISSNHDDKSQVFKTFPRPCCFPEALSPSPPERLLKAPCELTHTGTVLTQQTPWSGPQWHTRLNCPPVSLMITILSIFFFYCQPGTRRMLVHNAGCDISLFSQMKISSDVQQAETGM